MKDLKIKNLNQRFAHKIMEKIVPYNLFILEMLILEIISIGNIIPMCMK